ncbi:MAG TPA: O-acetylhomoserine aminocarboxypropyltransferase/cysteine synthase [Firmicutes bacterium]|nr:O-acetylhomoserine aminocarboxypropyltransferase/cysteine synthase [Bacillota bacterium]
MQNLQNHLHFDTIAVNGGYQTEATTKVTKPPIYMSNAYAFDSAEHAARLFSLEESGNIYTRLNNPTTDVLEQRVAALDNGVAALAFSSGHAAMFAAFTNLANAGDEIVASAQIYGGAINMMGVTLDRLGIKVTFVDVSDLQAWEQAITEKTKALFFEVVGNPNANVADIEAIAEIGHRHGVPVIVDSTFTTPYLCRPLEHGADYVIHSATKFLGGHAAAMAGIVVDGGSFDFKGNPRFPLYNEPDVSYHGLVFADLGATAFITRLRTLGLRDLGSCISPFNSFLILQGIETLSLRMERHCQNAMAVAEFLENHPLVTQVNYPGLASSPYKDLVDRYLPLGAGAVFTFELKGGREAGAKFINNLQVFCHCANVGDVRSLVSHPASTTHSQLSAEQLAAAGISSGLVRLSIGIEDVRDLIADLDQAINAAHA